LSGPGGDPAGREARGGVPGRGGSPACKGGFGQEGIALGGARRAREAAILAVQPARVDRPLQRVR